MTAFINYAISHARLTLATLAFLLVAGFIARFRKFRDLLMNVRASQLAST